MPRLLSRCTALSAVVCFAALAEVEAQPLTGSQDPPGAIEFSGPIDGSERIEITRSGAVWFHLHRELPTRPMTVNGLAWDPREQRTRPNRPPTRFLDPSADLSRARLKVIEGRDTVAMTREPGRLIIHLDDTPNGEGWYRFRIAFDSDHATLRVRARIDGSDVLRITRGEARWEHKHWDCPDAVFLNEVRWNPAERPTLPNQGETTFLPESVDFSTARVVHRDGRDLAVVVPQSDGIAIHFADNPNGADDYELLISFGP